MKLVLTACMLLVPFFSVSAATMQPQKFQDKESRIMRDQQTAQTRLLISGYLYVGPAVKKTPADTSSLPQASANAKPESVPQEKTAQLLLNGNSGERAQ